MIEQISLKLLDPHPDNPRLELREEVIASIQAQIREHGYHEKHAIIARRTGKRFQTLDGHHRVEAANREELTSIPAWVDDYTDEEAFMQLVLANAQSGLTPLELGQHASKAVTKNGANNGTSIAKYATRVCTKEQTVRDRIHAYEVFKESTHVRGLDHYFRHLVAIHAAPPHLWAKLATRMVEEGWSVAITKAEVKKVQPPEEPKAKPKAKPLITRATLSEWKAMSKEQQADLLNWQGRFRTYNFVDQKGEEVGWARQSHNPVTGCLHNCPYCYAREIGERIYKPEGFEPTLHVDRLNAPYAATVPPMAETNLSYKNVFMCSMADLFGKWVPPEWIEAVLKTVRDNPQWNFLFLTKFPQRMAEFEYPDNAWLGTTIDLQARVANAERAMRKVKAKVKWLSVEPMLDPLRFEDLSTFQWIVIGGASPTAASTGATPEWRPPRRWVWDLTFRAWDAGCRVYHKENLNNELKEFPFGQHKQEPTAPLPVFQYLKVIE